MTTEESNKLIDEFMGMEAFALGYDKFQDDKEYHSSWDWLMPVVEKIEHLDPAGIGNTYQVIIYEEEIEIYDKSQFVKGEGFTQIVCVPADGSSKRENTYKAVIQFIDWYNRQNPLTDIEAIIRYNQEEHLGLEGNDLKTIDESEVEKFIEWYNQQKK